MGFPWVTRQAFTQAALSRFGSGWAWLGVTPDGALKVTSTANQEQMGGITSNWLIIVNSY